MTRILFRLGLFLFAPLALATHLQPEVDALINQVDPNINLGVVVIDLNTNETLYERNPTRSFIPASNMKLFSDAAALLALGPDYRFKSNLTTDAPRVDKGTLKGSLYLQLPGDPSFSKTDLDHLLVALPQWGIRRIQGNVVLVSNTHQIASTPPGRMASDGKYSYGASVSPVMFDENRITITVNPASKVGKPAWLELGDPDAPISLINHVKTTAHTTRCGLNFNMDDKNQVTVSGCIAVGQWAVQERIAIRHPLYYAQTLIRSHLAQLNIQLEGQILLGQAPNASLLLSSHRSKPIAQLMADTLKPSDNLYADSLFLHTATILSGSPLNWQQAQPIVKQFLQQQTEINLQSAVLIDGSGLSRNDLLTPQQTVDLLKFLHDRFPLSYEYIAALPIAGQDGTLQKRFRKPTQQGLLRAKTGTMTGIMSLSGYLYTANSHTLAFAIYINKTKDTKSAVSGRYRSLVDNLCDFFLQQKPDNTSSAHTERPNPRVAFQQQPSEQDKQQVRFAKWRQLESALKQSLQGQSVTVLFQTNQLILKDSEKNPNTVWSTLQRLRKKYLFTVALHSRAAPKGALTTPLLVWIKTTQPNTLAIRTWTLRESV